MNKQECAMVIAILQEFYPKNFEAATIKTKVNAWHLILKDYDYKSAEQAALAFVAQDTKGFPPVVGQIVNLIINSQANINTSLTEMEAWNLVVRALSNSSYNSESEFEKLPAEVKRGVGSAEQLKIWSLLDIKQLNTVIQSNFTRSYKAAVITARNNLAIPSCVQNSLPKDNLLQLSV